MLPLGLFPLWAGLVVLSVMAGIAALFVFRRFSNQERILAAKQRVKAHLLEIRLFKDDPALVMGAQGRVLRAVATYFRHILTPVAVMIAPFFLLMLQMDLYFGYQPLRSGESTIVSVRFRDKTPWEEMAVSILSPPGLIIETPALRIPEDREVNWRVKAEQEGRFDLMFRFGDRDFHKEVVVSRGQEKIVPAASGALPGRVFSGAEALPSGTRLESIEVKYRPKTFGILGWETDWLVPFLLVSFGSAYALRGFFGVEI